ncbi:MAG: 16S rRNA (cytidine(1402)-2'-O)-methyltransferase [Gaiellaceae bacterium]
MPLAVCATPIGNLDDITLRVLDELRAADVVLAEDTRHTRGLLERHEIAAQLLSYHEHNEASRVSEVLPRLEAGERVALVTDAGMPLVSDPGARLVRAALEAGIPVTVLPGASAVDTALVASGLGGGPYAFVGFLPRKPGELEALWRATSSWGCAVVAFESPQRVGTSLAALAALDPDREVAVCRELTKRFEEVVRGRASELAARFSEPPKGEVTVVVAPGRAAVDVAGALRAVGELVAAGAPRGVAAEVVGRLSGVPRNDLYRGTL